MDDNSNPPSRDSDEPRPEDCSEALTAFHAQSAKIRIVAVTPVHNRKDTTLACLKTLFASELEGIHLHAIVVDDGSTDGTADAIQDTFPQAEIIAGDGTLWYSEGVNVGVRAALARNPDFILIYNDDSRFPPNLIRQLLNTAQFHPTSLVGPALVDWDSGSQVFQTGIRWQTSYGGWRPLFRQTVDDLPSGPFPVEMIAGNCILIPTRAFRDAGLMKSDTLPNFGDSELTARMRRQGWRLVIDPAARLLCQPNEASARLSTMSFGELYGSLWGRRTSYHNLRQKFAVNKDGAPSRWQGYAASLIFLARVGLQSVGLSGRWPAQLPERPLKETVQPLSDPLQSQSRLIVFGWPYTDWGGVQTYKINLMRRALDKGYRIASLVPENMDPEQLSLLQEHCGEINFIRNYKTLEMPNRLGQRLAFRINRRLTERMFKAAVESHVPPEALLHADIGPHYSSGFIKKLSQRNRMVMTVHTGLAAEGWLRRVIWRRKFARLIKNPRLRLIAANEEARRSLAPYLEHAKLDHIPVSRPSFNRETIEQVKQQSPNRAGLEEKLGLSPTSFRIVIGAQFIERKGYHILIEAMRRLKAQGSDIRALWIAPAAPTDFDQAELDKAIAEGLLDFRLHSALGPRHEDYLAAIASLADIFVLPSLVEGLPMALVEAMALEICPLATSINSVPDLIQHRHNGILVEPNDPVALAAALESIAGDDALRTALAHQALESVNLGYASEFTALATLNVYDELFAS